LPSSRAQAENERVETSLRGRKEAPDIHS